MKKYLSCFFLLLLIQPVLGQNQLDGGIIEPCVYTIENVHVLPGNGDELIKNQDVVIYCGEILEIRDHVQADSIARPDNYNKGTVINGTGKYLLPSFADAHVHLPEKGELKNFFKMNLMNGVTTLRSMRGAEWHLEIDQQDELCPRLILGSIPIEEGMNFSLDTLADFVEHQKNLGFDFIKILGVDSANSFQTIIQLAKAQKIPLAGHCPNNISLSDIINSSIYQSIEHMGGLSAYSDKEALVRIIQEMDEANIYHCATLSWTYALSRSTPQLRKKDGVNYVSEAKIIEWEKSLAELNNRPEEQVGLYKKRILDYFKTQQANLRAVYSNGGKLLIGPDASDEYMIPGFDYHLELAQHAQLGVANDDLIQAACYNLAEMLGETDEWGQVKVGLKSDLLLLDANPLEDIENAKKIKGIFLKGKYLTYQEILEL